MLTLTALIFFQITRQLYLKSNIKYSNISTYAYVEMQMFQALNQQFTILILGVTHIQYK